MDEDAVNPKRKKWFSTPIIALCRSKVLQNALREHSAILSTFIKLPFVMKAFVLSILSGRLTQVLLCSLLDKNSLGNFTKDAQMHALFRPMEDKEITKFFLALSDWCEFPDSQGSLKCLFMSLNL